MAISLPLPIAIPRSDWANAALSLIPSPTIAVLMPEDWMLRMNSTLSEGSASARIPFTPSSEAAFAADSFLSPVKMYVSMPIFFRCPMPSFAVFLTWSDTARTADASPSSENQMSVPCIDEAFLVNVSGMLTPCIDINRSEPALTSILLQSGRIAVPHIPRPVAVLKSLIMTGMATGYWLFT